MGDGGWVGCRTTVGCWLALMDPNVKDRQVQVVK